MTEQNDKPASREQEPIVIRDKRRVAPDGPLTPDLPDEPGVSGGDGPAQPEADQSEAEAEADAPAQAPELSEAQLGEVDRLTTELADRTGDLQRVTAEYANYRRRTDREREDLVPIAQATLVAKLLPVLDDIDRAAEHGDLNGGFKNVADALRQTLTQSGLEEFGAEGDEFDPQVHQAVAHNPSKDVDVSTVGAVMRKGYRYGERVLREAMVAVTTPED